MIATLRALLAFPFVVAIMLLATLLWSFCKLAAFLTRTAILISVGEQGLEDGPQKEAHQRLTLRALAFFEGRCWKCGAYGGDPQGLDLDE